MKQIIPLILLACISALLLTACNTASEKKSLVTASDLKIIEKNGVDFITFTVNNNNNMSGACNAIITLTYPNTTEDNQTLFLGTYAASETRKESIEWSMPPGRTNVSLKAGCTWLAGIESSQFVNISREAMQQKDLNACNVLANEEQVLCSVIAQNSLAQCLDASRNFASKFFCAAMLSQNSSFCSYIANDYERNHCLAYLTSNASKCDAIIAAHDKDYCYFDLSVNWRNISLCDSIAEQNLKKACTAIFKGDSALCSDVGPDNMYVCILYIAINKGDINICNLLQNKIDKERCISEAKQSLI